MEHRKGSPMHLLSNSAQAERLHTFAHDLRNRLAGLQQVLNHLSSLCNTEEERALLTFGEQQQFKALREVEQLLDDMGVVRGVGHLALASTPLHSAVDKAIGLLAHRFQRKEQEVVLDMPTDIRIMAEAHHLGEVLNAVLSNASKFSPRGSSIHVHARSTGDRIALSVIDHGVGLSAEDLEQVFTRYAWLASRPTEGEAQGRSTLARARQWMHAMEGELTASSAGAGEGCTFTATFQAA
jgi:two-component system, OmpR family, phosphate regulon sensor histidine kinase PhoR